MKLSKNTKDKKINILTIIWIIGYVVLLLSFMTIIHNYKENNKQLPGKFDQIIVTKNNIHTMYDLYHELDVLYDEKNEVINDIRELQNEKNELSTSLTNQYDGVINKFVPNGQETCKTYMCYYQNWTNGTKQSQLHSDVCDLIDSDDYGYVKLGDRYFVAVKPYYGQVGDYINVRLSNDCLIKCIIGDNKGFENSDIYTHYDGSILEFMVTVDFKGVQQTRPDFCYPIVSIQNIDNYYN